MVTQSKVESVASGKATGLFCCKQCAKDYQKPRWDDIVALFAERDYTLLSTEYVNAKTPLEYICNKHRSNGVQLIRYGNLKSGFGCKYCGRERQADKRRSSFEQVREVFAKHDMELLDQIYVNSATPMKYICKHHPECGVQYMTASNARVQHCPYCNVSKGEEAIRSYLIAHKIPFEAQKRFNDLGVDVRHRLSYDFYIPDANLLIEYQGEQHEHPVSVFGGQDQFNKQVENDRQKREYAKNNNIRLVEVWYYDYNNIPSLLDGVFNIDLSA